MNYTLQTNLKVFTAGPCVAEKLKLVPAPRPAGFTLAAKLNPAGGAAWVESAG